MTLRLTFSGEQRLHTPAEYKRVYDLRHSVGNDCLLVFSAWNDLGHTRLGTSVSRKVGNSVVRHRWKRRIREAFRVLQHELPQGLDLIVLPRAVAIPEQGRVEAALRQLMERAVKRWPAPRIATAHSAEPHAENAAE